jgi:hypothetical protein
MSPSVIDAKGGPTRLGAQRTFGFGDRLGFAAGAHLELARQSGFAPILAQHSDAELTASSRTAGQALLTATEAARGFSRPWGTDADHVTTVSQAESFARAGFTRLTLDPSTYFVERAHELTAGDLDSAAIALVEDNAMPAGWADLYLGHDFPISATLSLRFTPEELLRTAVKFGWAMAFVHELCAAFATERGSLPYELEISLIRTATRTTALEHLFIAVECRRRGLPLVALAPHLPGWWEACAAYTGDLAELASELATHAALATALGPHQLSIPEIEGKELALPVITRACGPRFHVKTSAASLLEAMRTVIRVDPPLFHEILALAQERFPLVRGEKFISVTEDEVRCLPDVSDDQLEATFLGDARGRQLLDVTFRSIWTTGTDAQGVPIRDRITAVLSSNLQLYHQLVTAQLGSLITALQPT